MVQQQQQEQVMIDNMTTVANQQQAEKKKRERSRKSSKPASEDASISSSDASNKSPPRRRRRKNSKKSSDASMTDEEKSRYLALDCEMVGVGRGGHRSSLARVCVISWTGKKIFDKYVRQTEAVTNYRTFVSGITEEHLTSDKTLCLEDCRKRVQKLLNGRILIGHALKNDLQALGITHPWYDIRDTGKYEPFMKMRFDDGVMWPRKLKDLAKEKLGRDIQDSSKAHSPVEDAKTALDLYKLVRKKWEKVMAYKLNKTKEIEKLSSSDEENELAPQ
mmetsp:Transcript_7174/g.10918  ORF Transcript_7174/g.10918 Transcript_7174/m.10918 type:complete len:276 (-) Transcript_7174:248-1075(-)